MSQPYFQPPGSGPRCSTERSARLRQHRFDMGYEERAEPETYRRLAAATREVFLACEGTDAALARARAVEHVAAHCPVELEIESPLLGGENPFFFNLLLPALRADAYSRDAILQPTGAVRDLREARLFSAPCFEGHITPGIEYVLGQGVSGLRQRLEEGRRRAASAGDEERAGWHDAALVSCQAVLTYADRYRAGALALAAQLEDSATANPHDATTAAWAHDLRAAADDLAHVPLHPARTLREALQSYWLAYCLVTVEMGGCCPGGGLGLGRPDQYLYPYLCHDLEAGVLTRPEALELLEIFLLQFRHVDYYTDHQVYTPGSQASLGGVTPTGLDASNELTELLMEASLRIAMPAPYLSLRLHADAPDRYWQAAANYVVGGLGFAVVNDGALIPAFLRHGRSLADARDYICSCCYENTIPGREAFHPNGSYLNLPLVLELALNHGCTLNGDISLGPDLGGLDEYQSFDEVVAAFHGQLERACDVLIDYVNRADAAHSSARRYPLMSAFMEDCIAAGRDVCAGGARYNATGTIVSGLPNVVNSLAALRETVFGGDVDAAEVLLALRADFAGFENVRQCLLQAPKWGNDNPHADDLVGDLTEALYALFAGTRNPRGGPWQVALYSFVANHGLGEAVGASADGRRAGESLTRNLNPAWGTDREGPTAVLHSLSRIDFTAFPNGSALDLRFDPAPYLEAEGRQGFVAFLKGFVELGVMQMQVSMVDRETLLEARQHPEKWPNLMVKVAGFSARFIDLSETEQTEIINRTTH